MFGSGIHMLTGISWEQRAGPASGCEETARGVAAAALCAAALKTLPPGIGSLGRPAAHLHAAGGDDGTRLSLDMHSSEATTGASPHSRLLSWQSLPQVGAR